MELPLVSIVVLAYNSSKFILETLYSAYRQTYKGPIELIITDDSSTDNTVQICKNWLKENADRFARVELLEAEENEGVTKNVNKGCRAARGEWIKPIAGDDVLIDTAVDTYLKAAQRYGGNCMFLSTPVYYFNKIEEIKHPEKRDIFYGIRSNKIDLNYFCSDPFFIVPAPSFFIRKDLLEALGYYPLVRRNTEDLPLTRKLIGAGYTIHILSAPLCFYRCHDASLTHNICNLYVEKLFFDCYKKFIQAKLSIRQRCRMGCKFLPIRVDLLFNGRAKFLRAILYRINKILHI